jgi:hypothetical protein
MAREYIGADGSFVNETGAREYVSQSGTLLNESGTGQTPPTMVTIDAAIGAAAAQGVNAAITAGGGATISCAVGAAVAAGALASLDTKIVTSVLMNNTESIHAAQAVVWSWFPSARIGTMAAVAAADGAGTTGSDGRLVTTISRAPGILMVAKQGAGASSDDVYYEAFQ